jgi:hypothetical protein
MAKPDFILARQQTHQFLQAKEIGHHMFHGPTSDEYWSAPLRVLAVNMESYGYDGHTEVDIDCLLDWMYDRGHTRTKTVRYTFAVISTLINAYIDSTVPTRADLRMAYSDATALEAVARRAVYYNIRPTSNENKEQDFASIVASGSCAIAEFTRREMVALEPQVILVSGHAGLAAFNAMWRLEPELRFLEGYRYSDSTYVQSIRHPSRPNYEEYASILGNLLRDIKARACVEPPRSLNLLS